MLVQERERELGVDLGNGFRVGYKQLMYLNTLRKQGINAEFMVQIPIEKQSADEQFEVI